MNDIEKNLLHEVAELDALPVGAYNIRSDSKSIARNTTANIDIITKTDKSGIDIKFKPGTKQESVHIPVIISQSGLKESVYNDFFIADDCDITIVAGCGISNCGGGDSQHDGIHTFYVGKNCKVRYIEKHYGEGSGSGKRIMNPETIIHLGENSTTPAATASYRLAAVSAGGTPRASVTRFRSTFPSPETARSNREMASRMLPSPRRARRAAAPASSSKPSLDAICRRRAAMISGGMRRKS